MAKTQYSFSDDQTLLGAPNDFEITIRELEAKTGAGFIVALTGAIMTMPGLPKKPAALNMDVTDDGKAIGLSKKIKKESETVLLINIARSLFISKISINISDFYSSFDCFSKCCLILYF